MGGSSNRPCSPTSTTPTGSPAKRCSAPVIAVIPFDDDEDAIRIANDSEYGLGGSVWSSDEERALAVARRVRTGTIGLNYYDIDLGAPFGGMKDSGIGRELGPEGLDNYLEYKSIYTSADRL